MAVWAAIILHPFFGGGGGQWSIFMLCSPTSYYSVVLCLPFKVWCSRRNQTLEPCVLKANLLPRTEDPQKYIGLFPATKVDVDHHTTPHLQP